ncbi:SMIM14 family protein [Xanthomonas sacchari]|uniref:SMIM14 family protein n=1 Tax=Xanthomonas sacchari TaxID=56458 RepID=UPI00225A4BD6|nr:SMIM14 family protein [Xanthomonas sacchari]UYK67232.1 SMIM14 family protein [Xanthomonas sacchari]
MTNQAECAPPKRPPNEYRQWLIAAEQKAQDDFDKAVLSLSGGALGISFVFVKDIIGPEKILEPAWLLLSWIGWGLSSLAILASYFFSHLALRQAIRQCDDGTIYSKTPGGIFARITGNLNAIGAILFVVGVCFMAGFIYINLSSQGDQSDKQKASQPAQQAAIRSNPKPSGTRDGKAE